MKLMKTCSYFQEVIDPIYDDIDLVLLLSRNHKLSAGIEKRLRKLEILNYYSHH